MPRIPLGVHSSVESPPLRTLLVHFGCRSNPTMLNRNAVDSHHQLGNLSGRSNASIFSHASATSSTGMQAPPPQDSLLAPVTIMLSTQQERDNQPASRECQAARSREHLQVQENIDFCFVFFGVQRNLERCTTALPTKLLNAKRREWFSKTQLVASN